MESFPRVNQISCTVQGGGPFTLEELKGAGGRLKANTAPEIDWLTNEILKELIMVYSEILEAFNSFLRLLEEAEVGPSRKGREG